MRSERLRGTLEAIVWHFDYTQKNTKYNNLFNFKIRTQKFNS